MKQFLFTILMFCCSVLSAQEISYETFTYFENDTLELQLDFFEAVETNEQKTPLFIFIHGGGFQSGDRSAGHPICEYLAARGIASASISYTLYMKEDNFGCNGITSKKIETILKVSNQLLLATQYFTDRSERFNIDDQKIFLAGGSAGAEVVLQTCFSDKMLYDYFPVSLPETFKFAGLISGAGAFIDINELNEKTTIPTLLFHGTADKYVPYNIAPHHYCNPKSTGWMMMFGGYAIHNKNIQSFNTSSHLVSYCQGGHEYAGKPFREEKKTIYEFIERVVRHEKFSIHQTKPSEDHHCALCKE